jgi:cell division initiation protein
MSISRIDILNQKFSRSLRGYSPTEVDRCMQEAADTIGRLSEDRSLLEARVTELEARLRDFKDRENALRDTLLTAQKVTDELKSTAQREAQLIIDAAYAKAENLINQGHQRLAKIHEEINASKKMRAQFEMKVQAVIDSHQQLIEMNRKEDEQLDAMEKKVAFLKANTG